MKRQRQTREARLVERTDRHKACQTSIDRPFRSRQPTQQSLGILYFTPAAVRLRHLTFPATVAQPLPPSIIVGSVHKHPDAGLVPPSSSCEGSRTPLTYAYPAVVCRQCRAEASTRHLFVLGKRLCSCSIVTCFPTVFIAFQQ
ncbi:hypothetical protein XA68_13133 [Ophiocordyceps unilateralis]|uniref:LITAF domain-containing protein n=1 Tax=Ophiocordyceps unilateralis TaxID=268505 RepID=A0A2A9PNB6_OPHUN|nr:hypothetical protein XA68_13133 [Ophiocordyceps unilateralis]